MWCPAVWVCGSLCGCVALSVGVSLCGCVALCVGVGAYGHVPWRWGVGVSVVVVSWRCMLEMYAIPDVLVRARHVLRRQHRSVLVVVSRYRPARL